MLKLIIFDWDDVFTLGSQEGYLACYHEAAKAVGVELDPITERERILSAWGRPHRDEIAALLKEHPELVDRATPVYERAILSDTFTGCLTLVEGSLELLTDLRHHYTLALATGLNPQVMKERVFPKFQVPPVFSQIVTSYDLPDRSRGKPHPDMALKILHDQHILPEQAVMVGDAPGDMSMGKAAGLRTVAVLTGLLDRAHAEEMGVDYIIENILELKELLLQLT